MAKKPNNKKVNEKGKHSKKAPAVSHRSKDDFYRDAGFKNSNIVLGYDVLKKLQELSHEMFNYRITIGEINRVLFFVYA
ncbi:hypothetical protein NGC32_08560 [Kluyvera cryocrescens]|uniref:hypothetical protein n=1 Tax=Kluyvera cryocrescens TaxID=580 RepID=UPI002DBE273F|nr:hypothetical protein [Kluyvera cryocrescens]MEB7712780.1 hypothetical protein [Kluyvera cryocrescens]